MMALAEYNRTPYDLDARNITMAELYARWVNRPTEQIRLSASAIKGTATAYKHCSALYEMPYTSIRAHMMQSCIDGCIAPAVRGLIKNLFYTLDRYALELDIIQKKYSDLTHVEAWAPKRTQNTFSDVEVARLWDNADAP